jgi:hypothetical protein
MDGQITDQPSPFRRSLCVEVRNSYFLSGHGGLTDGCATYSNMLTITFGTRTGSTADPLTERALALATEFNDLTGKFVLPYFNWPGLLTKVGHRSTDTLCRFFRTTSMDSHHRANTWTSAT